MNAAVVSSFDKPPRFQPFPDPDPNEDEVPIEVHAAALHPVVKAMANGSHYGSTKEFPFIPGVDGVGRLQDGTRVFFGTMRKPYGAMAERAIAPRFLCLPLPGGMPDVTAAALGNPGMSSWSAFKWRAQLVPGETVLVLGATGVAGQLAVQIAKHLGAKRVIAAGRNQRVLGALQSRAADAIISLDQPDEDLMAAFRREAAPSGLDVVIDYLWGRPTECLLQAISRKGLAHVSPRMRLVQIGESAGQTISLPAAVLRSSGLEISGSGAGSVPFNLIMEGLAEFFQQAATGQFQIDLEPIPLANIEQAWNRETHGRRLVFTMRA